MPGLDDIGVLLIAAVLLVGFCAGFVDAVVGGGGLLQLPILLLIPGISPVQALATNKLGSVFGTATSSITYYRRVRPDVKTALPAAVAAFGGSYGGAILASRIPGELFKPIIVVALTAVFVFTVLRPSLGEIERERLGYKRHYAIALLIGALIGVYDGVIGPGTGSFLVISLVGLLGYTFLEGSAIAKIINVFTNLGALAFFIPYGAVIWQLGFALGAVNCLGGYVGARVAIARGSKFVRVFFLLVVAALIGTLAVSVVGQF